MALSRCYSCAFGGRDAWRGMPTGNTRNVPSPWPMGGRAQREDMTRFELTPGPPGRTAVMIESTITSEVVAAPTER